MKKISYSRLNSVDRYVQVRYLRLLLKNYPSTSYIYHNGSEGMDLAILIGNIADNYNDAVDELASREGVTTDDIINDYKNWYYVIDIYACIDSLTHDVNYYHPVISKRAYDNRESICI